MDWKHLAIAVIVFVGGFYVAKKWPSLFASVPVIGPALG